jgi:hypothetical protein
MLSHFTISIQHMPVAVQFAQYAVLDITPSRKICPITPKPLGKPHTYNHKVKIHNHKVNTQTRSLARDVCIPFYFVHVHSGTNHIALIIMPLRWVKSGVRCVALLKTTEMMQQELNGTLLYTICNNHIQ